MAFPVAVQSAIFYVLACTPCLSARTRYRTRKQSRREREARARLDDEEPELYRHPSPFNVNPYWQEEIMMGPSLPKKGKAGAANKNVGQRKLASAGKENSVVTRSSLASSINGTPQDSSGPLGGSGGGASWSGGAHGNGTIDDAAPPASPTLVPDDTNSMSMLEATATNTTSNEGWNHQRYQREDEELWGNDQSRKNKLMGAIVKAGSSAGRLLESTLGKDRAITDEDRAKFYTPAVIHPPVNEYHPPVVSSKPAYKDGLHWMLQPPPPAKVMEGKVPVSRSGSVASSTIGAGRRSTATTGSEVSLTRKMAMEARRRRAESNGSTVGSHMRAMTPSAENTEGAAAACRSPNRAVSRNTSGRGSGLQPKSQHRGSKQGRNRSQSGSGSLSSVEAAGWSSDDDGGLKLNWQLPSLAGAAMASGPGTKTTTARGAGLTEPDATQLSATHSSMRPKLSTIVSSDAGSTISAELSDGMVHKAGEAGQGAVAGGSEDEAKVEHLLSVSSSLDSGLALAA